MGDVTPLNRICKVLIVEDDGAVREVLADVFESEGYRFILTANAAEMRAALASDPAIDILIIDVRLRGGDSGLVLAAEAASRGLPVVLTSGDHAQLDEITKSGHPYILKPFRLSSLLALVEETLEATKANCRRGLRAAS